MSLKTRILIILGLSSLLGSLISAAFTLRSHWEGALRSLDFRLERAAYAAAYVVGQDYHESIFRGSWEIPGQEYRSKIVALNDLAEKMAVRKVSALVMHGERVYFSASSGEGEFTGSGSYRVLDRELIGVSNELRAAFAGEQPICAYGRPENGECRCALVPQRTASGSRFVIAVEFPIESVEGRYRELITQYGFQALVFFLIPFALVSFFFGRASRHLQQLSNFTTTLVERNFSPDPSTIAGIEEIAREHPDEIGQISSSLASMHSALGKYIGRLERATAEREKLESEMRIAGDIQRSIVPKRFPPFSLTEKAEVFATLRPAQGVGGDFFDFSLPASDRLLILAGDVSGKGVPAALFMALTTALLKAYGQQGLSPKQILEATNRHLCLHNDQSMFATVFCGILNLGNGSLEFAVGGHNPGYILGEGSLRELPVGGMALGLAAQSEFLVGTEQLRAAETLILYTDGVTEAASVDQELFSEKRLFDLLRTCVDQAPHALVTKVLQEVERFATGAPQADDIMVMAVRRHQGWEGGNGRLAARLAIRNALEEYPAMSRFFAHFFETHSVPARSRHDCMVAVEEAVSNVIRHGFPTEGNHEIAINTGIVGGSLIVELRDDGVSFNPLNQGGGSRSRVTRQDEVGGWGIALIRKLVSSLEYRREEEKNILRLRFDLPTEECPDIDVRGAKTMDISEKITDSIVTLGLSGRIDTQTSGALEAALENLLERGYLKILLDFSNVEYITSGGLRVLMHYSRKVQPEGGTLIMVALRPEVKKVFQMMGFLTILHHFPTLDEGYAKLLSDVRR